MTLKEFLDENGIDSAVRQEDWNGYAVYEPDRKQYGFYSGPPVYVLVKDGEVRLTSDEEGFSIYREQLKKSGYVDDEEEMIPDNTLSGKGEH